jgi:hypothetical protein
VLRLIEDNHDALVQLCRRHHVRKIEIFGSALTDQFNDQKSDLDFIVSFDDLPPGRYAEAYFDLLEELQKLFQRPIDLVIEDAIKNPYFLGEIEKTRTLLYAA